METDVRLLEYSNRIKDLEDQLKRLAAEYDNYRKRSEKERELVRENAAADVYLRLLPIIDEFELAVNYAGKVVSKGKDGEFLRGFEMIYGKLLDLLKKDGVMEMAALGNPFDPYKHDALRMGDGVAGKIIEVVQKGYVYRGKVLRHAKVVVGNGKEVNNVQ